MDKFSVPRPVRESTVKHKRDVQKQIILPMVIASSIGVALAVLSGFAAASNNSAVTMWADISIIWLIIPMMLLALIIFMVMFGLVYGLNKLLHITPYYTGLLQSYILWLHAKITLWTNNIMNPVLSIKTWLDLILKQEEKNGK